MRIAIGGFLHESHSFAPRPTTYADFLQPGGLPPFDGLIEAVRPRSIPRDRRTGPAADEQPRSARQLTEAMVRLADAVVPFRTYPYVKVRICAGISDSGCDFSDSRFRRGRALAPIRG